VGGQPWSGMYQCTSHGEASEDLSYSAKKTGPLRDRLRQVEPDRVFCSHSSGKQKRATVNVSLRITVDL
jgi:hypothetical protein